MTWSALEQAIVDRLKDRVGPLVKRVYTTAEYADVEEVAQLTPSIAVIYQSMTPEAAAGGNPATFAGRVQTIRKLFYVVVAMRSALNTKTASGARDAAAPIVDATIFALLGWRPQDLPDEGPLQMAASPGPAFTDAGFAYYPIAFSNRRTYRGT